MKDRGQNENTQHPTLDALIAQGIVKLDGTDYYGVAADGTEVGVGTLGFEADAERFLEHNSDPKDWS